MKKNCKAIANKLQKKLQTNCKQIIKFRKKIKLLRINLA